MAKVRVYELAKESGIESKEMTAKLIEMGYDVKSHSSSLDEHTADQIRIKLGIIKTKVEEKRILGKGKTTIIRRRRSIREKKPEVVPPEPAVIPEAAAEPVPEEVEKKSVKVAKPVKKKEKPASAEEEPEEKAVEPEAPVEKEEKKKEEEEVVAPEPEKKEADRSKKGLARVIKKSAIYIPPEEEKAKPKPKPRPKPKKAEAGKGKAAGFGGGEPEAASPAKGKKGKRFVKFQPEPEGREKAKRGGKRKGRVIVEMDDMEALAGHLPSSLRLGRKQRGGPKRKKSAAMGISAISEAKAIKRRIKMLEFISVGDLAHRMGIKANEVIAKLMGLGIMASLNQALDVDTATLLADDFGFEIEQGVTEEQSVLNLEDRESGGEMLPRPPVITVMGHVDHGKTSILDAIRKTDVAAGEAGGITQHIGAHYVRSAMGDVVFLDTPGHAAFTEMRSRGAKVTDVVVLVVAADDGMMDQTREAINHARAAEVPIVVAVNKIDKPDADPMRVMRELAEMDLVPEEWGGDTIYCQTSAKLNTGIEELLEQILLQAEILELKADPKRRARGHVIEAQLHKGRGPVATVLIQQGTLKVGDHCVVGKYHGKVRSLFNDKGAQVKEGGPSVPVEVHGLSGVPLAGDEFVVVPDEKMAKSVSAERQLRSREAQLASTTKISLDNLFEKLKEGDVKELLVLLRADVQGTLEAFGKAIEKLGTDVIKVKVLHEGTGTITDSDVLLAAASNAIIIGFNVRPSVKVSDFAKSENVDIRFYDVIYHALDDIRKAMVGMLEPTFEERVIGSAEVRETFHVSRIGTIAGCYVTDGKMERNAHVRLLRDGVVVYTGRLASLKRFKDDAKEVMSGYECGLALENFNDIKIGDTCEMYVMDEVAAVL